LAAEQRAGGPPQPYGFRCLASAGGGDRPETVRIEAHDRDDGITDCSLLSSVEPWKCWLRRRSDNARFPTEVLNLIAHELAHVHQNACGIRLKSVEDDGTLLSEDARGEVWLAGELEDDADATMAAWGFDPDAMDQWAIGQGIIKEVEATFEEALEGHDLYLRTGRWG
jgi:hypothetical protein